MSIPKHKMGLLIAALKPKDHDDEGQEASESSEGGGHYAALEKSLGSEKASAVRKYVEACLGEKSDSAEEDE